MITDSRPQVQVLLVGGRQTPNVIGVLTQKPTRVEFLISKDETERTIQGLRSALEPMKGVHLGLSDTRLDPFDFDANIGICREICQRYAGWEISFNLTGSTKIMALAAYEVAKECRASAFYVDTANHRIVPVLGHIRETNINLTIEQYLKAYGRTPARRDIFSQLSFNEACAVNAARLLGRGGQPARDLLRVIRASQKANPMGQRVIAKQDLWLPLASELAGAGILDLQPNQIVIRSSTDWNYCTGGWLEVFVWDIVRGLENKDGQPLYQECAVSLEIPSGVAKKEIDVVGLYQAQFVLCTCKAEEEPFKTAALDEISAVANLIGGRFCSRVFITHSLPPDDKRFHEFLDQAKQREIVVITGENITDLQKIMEKQAVSPDFWRV
jgi:hypothetical protein